MRRFKVIVDGREHDVQMVEVTEPDACPPETRGQALEPNCAATVERPHGGAGFSGQSGSAAGSAAAVVHRRARAGAWAGGQGVAGEPPERSRPRWLGRYCRFG